MVRTLVTGAGGLVGYAVRSLGLPEMVYLTRKEVDLTDFAKTKEIFNNIRPVKNRGSRVFIATTEFFSQRFRLAAIL